MCIRDRFTLSSLLALAHASGGGNVEHSTAFQDVLFPFMVLGLGFVINGLLSRFAPWFPYTVFMMLVGIGIGLIHRGTDRDLGVLSDSIHSWDNIDPHLLLYAFIPALIFGDSFTLNVHLVKKCFWQCFLLAGPGVVIGAGLMALVAHDVLPYHWNWKMSFTFGSITAATDPVAVVGLLNSLGASKKLTMVIAGESLMNDGVAIVGFNLFRNLLLGKSYDAGGVIEYLFQVALGGPAVGIAFGIGALIILSIMKRGSPDNHEQDLSNQTTLTFAMAYLSFFVGEHVCEVSGVLACVTAGVMIAAFAWPLLDSRQALRHVWHVVEFMGNTIVFTLSGTIIASDLYDSYELDKTKTGEYFGYMIVVYLFMVLIRAAMMIVLYPGLAYFGYGMENTWKDAFVGVWGGLRGAIGLVLCLIIDEDHTIHNDGAPFVVIIGGATFYTLVINGTTTGFILEKLGMLEVPKSTQVMGQEAEHYLHAKTQAAFEHGGSEGHLFARADKKLSKSMVSILAHQDCHKLDEDPKMDYVHLYSDVLLEMVRNDYWFLIEAQGIPVLSDVPRQLLESVEHGLDFTLDDQDSLQDWQYIEELVADTPWYYKVFNDCILSLFSRLPLRERNIYMVAAYIHAHEHSMKRMKRLFSHLFRFCADSADFGAATRTVSERAMEGTRESTASETAAFVAFTKIDDANNAKIAAAEKVLAATFGDGHEYKRAHLSSRWLAGATLVEERHLLNKYKEKGYLPAKTYEHLEEQIEEDLHRLLEHGLEHTDCQADSLGCHAAEGGSHAEDKTVTSIPLTANESDDTKLVAAKTEQTVAPC
eukprot:TRINITY_DN12585_c0_g1_i12.p1 TRINITY_DN12585_c0_g1~~TRINITY_DN12585_c0_g1_i12.p1  ORF type:complete len:815 (+),score=232.07 TRINITY_DN12585_c0_g1_i12:188-2632(+)